MLLDNHSALASPALTIADFGTPTTPRSTDFTPALSPIAYLPIPKSCAVPLTFLSSVALSASLTLTHPMPFAAATPALSRATLSARLTPASSCVSVLETCLLAALASEPVESGYIHPAESMLAEAFNDDPRATAVWAIQLLSGPISPTVTADVLRLVGRLPLTVVDRAGFAWRATLLTTALASPTLTLREAALETIENWGDSASLSLLQHHLETTPWLASYAHKIARDLTP